MDQCWRLLVGCLCAIQLVVGRTKSAEHSPVEFAEMEITSTISMRYARTEVITHLRNSAEKAQEATFKFLLPGTAFISGFSMIIDGKEYNAYVKEKTEAKIIYAEAVKKGLGAATVQTIKNRDSNRFMSSVNVGPNSTTILKLKYEELLTRINGRYNHAINLYPGGLVTKHTVTVHIRETQNITALHFPENDNGNEFDSDSDNSQYPEPTVTRYTHKGHATITYKPDLDQQKKLMEIYEKTARQLIERNSYLYKSQNTNSTLALGVSGQFVVQYDVFRSEEGEIVVTNGYFAQFLSAPTSVPALNKYVVFVLDTSQNMKDVNMPQFQKAMEIILSDLDQADFFSIVEFGPAALIHDLKEADLQKQPTPTEAFYNDEEFSFVPPSQATMENKKKAQAIIRRVMFLGGSNIEAAFDTALQLMKEGVQWIGQDANNLNKIIILFTNGGSASGKESIRDMTINYLEEDYVGSKASVYTLGFGKDADVEFMHKLALSNNRFSRRIDEASDAAVKLVNFFSQVSEPVYLDVKVTFPADQVVSDTVTKSQFSMVYSGGEEIVAGRIVDETVPLRSKLEVSFVDVDEVGKRKMKRKVLYPKAAFVIEDQSKLFCERLWAYVTIRQLLNERDLVEFQYTDPSKKIGPEKKALKLALQYGFVTPLTSLVVVEPDGGEVEEIESIADDDYVPRWQQGPRGPDGPALPGKVRPVSEPEEATVWNDDLHNLLESYNLRDYTWVLSKLNEDNGELVIFVNATVKYLKLYKKQEIPPKFPTTSCELATDDRPGMCVYLTLCESAKNIKTPDYSRIYCVVNNEYAGVCCPEKHVKI